MTTTNTAVQTAQNQTPAAKPKDFFAQENVKQKFTELMGKRSTAFITSILQCVASNKELAKADPGSIYQAAMMAATLDLPINNNLGFAYIIPYGQKDGTDGQGRDKYKQDAQFQLGYKGFIQLAQRSGQFKTISSSPIFEGQLIECDPLTGFVFDFTKKTSDKVVGYASYFKLLNGFEKTLYMTVEEVKTHGGKYSQSFKNPKTRSYSLWSSDFDAMANKTVLKLLLSKFAPLSIEMQKAVMSDQAVINDADTEDVTYVDNDTVKIDKPEERMRLMVEDCKTLEELEALQTANPDWDVNIFSDKKQELLAQVK